MIVGKSAVWVCVEALCHVMQSETVETPLQMKAVSCVAAIAADSRLHLAGTILISTLQSCFNLALTSSAPAVQARSRQVLRAAIKERVIKPVLEVAELALSGTIIDSSSSLSFNNNTNNNYKHPTSSKNVASASTTNAEIFNSTPSFMMLNFVKVYRPDQESFDPSEYLQNFKVTRMARFLEFAQEEKQVSSVLKDVVQILESFFRLGSHPISPSVKTPDDVEIKTRQLALECIITILSEFPDHAGRSRKFHRRSDSTLVRGFAVVLHRRKHRHHRAILFFSVVDSSPHHHRHASPLRVVSLSSQILRTSHLSAHQEPLLDSGTEDRASLRRSCRLLAACSRRRLLHQLRLPRAPRSRHWISSIHSSQRRRDRLFRLFERCVVAFHRHKRVGCVF